MKVFISWSGERSKRVAKALHDLIGDLMQAAKPWMSPHIAAGAWWNEVLQKQISDAGFGIVCITKDNLNAPWLHFEAGALAKKVEQETLVCPYLIDIEPVQLANTPLTHLQAKQATPSGTWDLIETINEQLGDEARPTDRLKRLFDLCYPRLGATVKELPESEEDGSERDPKEMIEEILVTVRDLPRRSYPSKEERSKAGWAIIEALVLADAHISESLELHLCNLLGIPPKELHSMIGALQTMPRGDGDF